MYVYTYTYESIHALTSSLSRYRMYSGLTIRLQARIVLSKRIPGFMNQPPIPVTSNFRAYRKFCKQKLYSSSQKVGIPLS